VINWIKHLLGLYKVECMRAKTCKMTRKCWHGEPHRVYFLKVHKKRCDEHLHDCQLAGQIGAICKEVK
jgi:hypothetical protein